MQDALIRFQIDLFRLDANARKIIIPILREMEKEMLGRLAMENLDAMSRARTNALLVDVREIINRHYSGVQAELFDTLKEVVPISARATRTALNAVTIGATLPAETLLKTLASNALIQGAVQKDWWARQAADTAWRFSTIVRGGVASGNSGSVIFSRVHDALNISQANAAALVQTAIATVSNKARMETFAQNADIIKQYRFVTALDQSVCAICAAVADKTWKPDDIGIPEPPLHYNCRCILSAEVFEGDQGGTRASSEGQIPASTTFKEFLDRQSSEWQDEALGKGRADMYRGGKITLQDLVDGRGRELTLEQLHKKYD